MEITNIVTEGVRIEWQVNDPIYPYSDVMLLKKEDYEALGESGVRMLQENQYNEWKSYILNPQG